MRKAGATVPRISRCSAALRRERARELSGNETELVQLPHEGSALLLPDPLLRALDPWSRAAGRIRDADSQRHPDAGGVVGVVLLEDDSGGVERLPDEVLRLGPVHQVRDVEVLAEEHSFVDVLPSYRG